MQHVSNSTVEETFLLQAGFVHDILLVVFVLIAELRWMGPS